MVRIESIKTSQTARASRNRKNTPTQSAFDLSPADTLSDAQAGPSIGGAGMVSGLMDLQEVSGVTPRERKLTQHGERLLDALDEVQRCLLSGTISPALLRDMAQGLKQNRELLDHSPVSEIVREIEQRIAIEIARFEVAHKTKI